MNKTFVSGFVVFVLVVVGIAIIGVVQIEIQQPGYAKSLFVPQAAPETPEPPIWFIVGIVAVVAMAGWAKSSPKTFFPILIVVLLGGFCVMFVFGDKDGDGRADSQIVKVIQPSGDIEKDAAYSEINRSGSITTLLGGVSLVVYMIAFAMIVVILYGAAVTYNKIRDSNNDPKA